MRELPKDPWLWPDMVPRLTALQLSELSGGEGPNEPLYQYVAVCEVLELRSVIESHSEQSGLAVLQAVAECARTGLHMPEWLAYVFLKRYRAVATYADAKSWDDPKSFGRPYKKGANIAAIRKARYTGMKVYVKVTELRMKEPSPPLDAAIREVASKCGVGETLAEEYYYKHKKELERIFPAPKSNGNKTKSPAKNKKSAGRRKKPS